MEAVLTSLVPAQARTTNPPVNTGLPCILLWLHGMGFIAPDALDKFGLSEDELETARGVASLELKALKQAMLCGDKLTRDMLARLLRSRIADLSATASTPAALATIARAVKVLPEWVWGDLHDGSQFRRARPQWTGAPPVPRADSAAGAGKTPGIASEQLAMLAAAELPQLNRAARRRLEKGAAPF